MPLTRYLSRGWRLLPVHGLKEDLTCTCNRPACPSPGKHPVQADWPTSATSDPDILARWPLDTYNVGLATGNGIIVFDFDGPTGLDTLVQLSDMEPSIQKAWSQRTGSGGVHVLFRLPVGQRTKNAVRILPGLDIRGDGGMIVLAPSKHRSGSHYEIMNDPDEIPELPATLAGILRGEAPEAFHIPVTLDVVKAWAENVRYNKVIWKKVLANKEGVSVQFAPHGSRNSTMFALCGQLARAFPFGAPRTLAEIFEPAINALPAESKTRQGGLQAIEGMIHRCQEQVRSEELTKPTINIGPEDGPVLRAASQALGLRAEEWEIYSQGGRLVTVSTQDKPLEMSIVGTPPQVLRPIALPMVRSYLSDAARWVVGSGPEAKVVPPPSPIVASFFEMGWWPEVSTISGLTYGPVLRSDGSSWSGIGYDSLTGLRGVEGWVPEAVSVKKAKARIEDVIGEFCFDSEVSKSAWLALVLSGIARYAFMGPTPLFLIDANVPGCGKTLLAAMASAIVTGRGPSRGSGMGRDPEEDRKKITTLARQGARFVLMDNVKGSWGTPILEELLTLPDGVWTDRLLGTNEQYSGPLLAVWAATSNNVRLRGDLHRRVCYVRLQGPEDPTARVFRIREILGETLKRRRQLYDAFFALLKAWGKTGRRGLRLPSWGSYEAWSSWVRGALVHADYPDPYENRGLISSESGAVNELVRGVAEVIQALGGAATPGQIAEAIWSGIAQVRNLYEGARTALVELHPRSREPQTGAEVGKTLAQYRGRIVDGICLELRTRTSREWVVKEVVE